MVLVLAVTAGPSLTAQGAPRVESKNVRAAESADGKAVLAAVNSLFAAIEAGDATD